MPSKLVRIIFLVVFIVFVSILLYFIYLKKENALYSLTGKLEQTSKAPNAFTSQSFFNKPSYPFSKDGKETGSKWLSLSPVIITNKKIDKNGTVTVSVSANIPTNDL